MGGQAERRSIAGSDRRERARQEAEALAPAGGGPVASERGVAQLGRAR
jgi:hypothetical protein